jgi:serine/threonine protein kinase
MSPVADYDLESYMTLAAGSSDKQSLLRTFFGCLSFGLQYLHDSKIRHRDIKPRNILVKGDMVFWTDFGISLDWEGLSRSTTTADSAKTLLYCAPEVANYEPRNSSSDIWSLGCVFLEMATVLKGQKIADMRAEFEERTGNYRFYRNIENAFQWVDKLRSLGNELDNAPLNWITKMLDLRSSSRPTAYALVGMITDEDPDELGVSASFCGACCLADPESPIGAESDGEAWIEKTARSEPSVVPLAYEPAPAEPHSHQAQSHRIGHPTQTEVNDPGEQPLARDQDSRINHANVQDEQLDNALLAASPFEHDQIVQRQGLTHESGQ